VLFSINIDHVESLFGKQHDDPLFYNMYEVKYEHLDLLSSLGIQNIELDKCYYYIACYCEPPESGR
jgi:hypothetical protein